MEHDGSEGIGEKKRLQAGFATTEVKKQWKNPMQVQILEDAYAVTPSPSAAMKEELSKLTGLDYKQVQYWFGNRRYMDRHGPRKHRFRNESDPEYLNMTVASSPTLSYSSMSLPDTTAGNESAYLNSEMLLQPSVPAGPVAVQAEVDTQMPQELQRIILHVEKKLGLPLRDDGPSLGVEFKPLPPGAFGTPLAQQRASLQPCDGKVTKQQTAKLNKVTIPLPIPECCISSKLSDERIVTIPLPIPECCISSKLSDERIVITQDVGGLNPDCSSKVVQEYQFFPIQPSWLDSYERIKSACPLPSASEFPRQDQLTGTKTQPQQEKQTMISSSLNDDIKAQTFFCTSSAIDSQSGVTAITQLDNQFRSSKKMITCNNHVCKREKIHLSGSTCDVCNQQLDSAEIMKIGAKKENDSVVADFGYSNSGHLGHLLSGQEAIRLRKGSREDQNSTVVIFKETNSKNCKPIVNHTNSSQSHLAGHRNKYSQYTVRRRQRSQSNTTVATGISYFSNTGDFPRPLVAEWNKREQKAVYFENDNESTLSVSTGSDSSCSDGYYQATENGRCHIVTNLVDQFNRYVKEDDIHYDQNGREVMDVDWNVVDDEDETDDDDYNAMEMESRESTGIDKERTPLSSEQTA